VRRWCKKFAASFADRLRRRRPRPGDKWHLDEVFIRIEGVQHYLWRAVDQDGVVLDILVQARRDADAAKRFFKRLLKGLDYVPRVIVTDKLRGSVANSLSGQAPSKDRFGLCRQRIELPCRAHFACRPQLAFPDHVHEFDAGKRHRG
jgi:transposase-like protein